MEEADTELVVKRKEVPGVPIKTYMWEDLRRSRVKGGYPWTHLYKPPFDEEPHPEHYTMEEFRRTRSCSSALGRMDALVIEELPNSSSSDRGSVEPIITEAQTPEPGQKENRYSITLESAESSDNVSQYLDKEDNVHVSSEQVNEPGTSKPEEDAKEPTPGLSVPDIPETNGRTERSKSEEPKRKRKLSVESSYSRISLSKLGILKKLRDAKDKIKVPRLSLRKKKAKSEEVLPKSEEKPKKEPKKPTEARSSKNEKPLYIHIPLKPPPGETDEFSYLEFVDDKKPKINKTDDEKQIDSLPSSPETTQTVQFIMVTPPSDDEILDNVNIPETPSEGDKFFYNKIDELKILAKVVVDDFSANKKLSTVIEEGKERGNGDEPNMETDATAEVKEEILPQKPQEIKEDKVETEEASLKPVEEKMVVDEEDGLQQSGPSFSPPVKDIESNLQKEDTTSSTPSLKTDSSPKVKKKVSFKRKSRKTLNKGIYEDVQAPKEAEVPKGEEQKIAEPEQITKADTLENSQSMSVDEEKSYLDEKIIKTTSLEEDYNKWSKINDHEYEPVNPPPDDIPAKTPPIVHITDTDLERVDSLNFAEDIQKNIEERYFNNTPETTSSRTDVEVHTSQVDSSAIEDLPLKRDSRKGKRKSLTQSGTPNKIQQAFKTQAGKIKTKFQNIQKPKFEKFKIEKPKIHIPKIPDTAKITLPFSKRTTKHIIKERQISTESNAGDTKKHIFNFSTYPRIFKRKTRGDIETSSMKDSQEPTLPVQFATVPRMNNKKGSKWAHTFSRLKKNNEDIKQPEDRWRGSDSVRIPLHPEDSIEKDLDLSTKSESGSHTRFNEDIGIDEAYERENQEIHKASPFSSNYNSRWNHGTFHGEPTEYIDDTKPVTDLDYQEEAQTPPSDSFDINASKEIHSSGSSFEPHQAGVLEEINPDEFFLRQKGISQDDVDVGRYLSSEIREAFSTPRYEENGSRESLREVKEKRRAIKKPKRKKTPHVSQEQINDGHLSDDEMDYRQSPEMIVPPVRPKRRSRRGRKPKNLEEVIPYQETIPIDSEDVPNLESQIIDDDQDGSFEMYENELMKGIEQPEIMITDPYTNSLLRYNLLRHDRDLSREDSFQRPSAPPRKQKSLKSLNYSEHDSIMGEPSYENHLRRQTLESSEDIQLPEEVPLRPKRTRSQSQGISQPDDDRTSRGADSLASDGLVPCVEEPCVQDIRDAMGYAIIDKTKVRDPPLPPPRTPPRRKRSLGSTGFSTVPRAQNEEQPIRPLRNYSTLGPSRPPRSKVPNLTDEEKREEKENIDITQYIEIEEEPHHRLQSGEIIQKMRERPLPAPPRPPRKPRSAHEDENQDEEEVEVSTQTDALSEEFISGEAPHETEVPRQAEDTQRITYFETPTHYTHQETVTHGTLIIEPLNGVQIIPENQLSKRERTIPIDYEETSEIPESFKHLKNPPQKLSESECSALKAEKMRVTDLDVGRLTVNELLANKIIVSEIDGGTIQIHEISTQEGPLRLQGLELPPSILQQICDRLHSIAQEQQSKNEDQGTSTLVGESTAEELSQILDEQKKISTEPDLDEVSDETPPQRPPRSNSLKAEEPSFVDEQGADNLEDSDEEPPQKPPRQNFVNEEETEEATFKVVPLEETQSNLLETEERPEEDDAQENQFTDLEVDDEPPPRPPPIDNYIPSQPPASFYALRAQEYVDYLEEDIPLPPRRRRHQKLPATPSSSDDVGVSVSPRRRVRSPEPSIPQLTGQLVSACSTAGERALKRLISHITENVLNNDDGKQDLHVMMIILLVLIAGLILLGFGDNKTVHHHHWEYFNPPTNL